MHLLSQGSVFKYKGGKKKKNPFMFFIYRNDANTPQD